MILESICDEVIKFAIDNNMDADVMVTSYSGNSFSCRNSKPESLIFSDEINITFRMISDHKCISMVTNNPKDLNNLMLKSLEMMPFAVKDPFIRIISCDEIVNCNIQSSSGELPSIESLQEMTISAEEYALKQHKIKNVAESSCQINKRSVAFATSSGFNSMYVQNSVALGIEVIAEEDGKMNAGHDYSVASSKKMLKNPIKIAESAVFRAVRSLGAKKIKSCQAPVIFEKKAANDILGCMLEALNADSVSKKMSFLVQKFGKQICSKSISIVDDPLNADSPYFVPFDGEGFTTRRNFYLCEGILSNWISDIRTAAKLGISSSANAYRSSSGAIRPAPYSVHFHTYDDISKESMVEDVKHGLYVTDLFSFGYNSTTGDYSKGVSGFWIENGKITYPVNEITIASNLSDMLADMVLANDLSFDYKDNSPTLFIPKMMIGGV